MNTIKRLLVNIAVFVAIFGLLWLVSPIDLSSLSVHGWGWALVIVSVFFIFVTADLFEGFFGRLLGDSVEVNPSVIYVVQEIVNWMSIGAGCIIGAWLAPSLVTAAAVPVLTYCGLIGLAVGAADVITDRLCYGIKRCS
jgi:hypothetical protein